MFNSKYCRHRILYILPISHPLDVKKTNLFDLPESILFDVIDLISQCFPTFFMPRATLNFLYSLIM